MYPGASDDEFTQRIVSRVKLGVNRVIPQYVAQSAGFDIQEQVGTEMYLTLMAEVLRDHVVSETQEAELHVAASWWQHFKLTYQGTWWMRRFARRYPVEYLTMVSTVHFDRYYDYPDARIALPKGKFGDFVCIETVTKSDWNKR